MLNTYAIRSTACEMGFPFELTIVMLNTMDVDVMYFPSRENATVYAIKYCAAMGVTFTRHNGYNVGIVDGVEVVTFKVTGL